jgi:hypothetical protein
VTEVLQSLNTQIFRGRREQNSVEASDQKVLSALLRNFRFACFKANDCDGLYKISYLIGSNTKSRSENLIFVQCASVR